MNTGPPKQGRFFAILACAAVAFWLALWNASHQNFRVLRPSPQQSQFVQVRRPMARELSPQAETSLAGSTLPLYELTMAPNDIFSVETQPFGNGTYPATFSAEGKVYQGVKVRARGSWSRSWPKKSLKILFDHKNPFQGHYSLNLNSGWRDPAFVREVLAYHVYGVAGVTAPRAQVVRLQVNGRFHGLYIDVEQPDRNFLARHQLKGAELFKAASRSRDADERDLPNDAAYQDAYSKETKKTEGYQDLAGFCHELARSPDASTFLSQHVDLDEYINYLAATVLIQHWDGFNKNHFLAYDRQGSGKWVVIPWDLDRTFGDHWQMRFDEARLPVLLGTRNSPGVTGWNRLEDRFFSQPALRARFLDRLNELLQKEFTTGKLFPFLDDLEKQIAPAAELDRARWPSPAGDLHSGIEGVKSFIQERRAYLLQEIPKLRRSADGFRL